MAKSYLIKLIDTDLRVKLKRLIAKISVDSFSSFTAPLIIKSGSLWNTTRNYMRRQK